MAMISVSKAGKQFDQRWIFRNVSFEAAFGESLVVTGLSGSGKTVLLKMLGGLIKPDEGTIGLGSANLGMLFQKNALFDSLTVEENLLFPLKERKGLTGAKAEKIAHDFLKAVGLEKAASLYPDEISGGMQKRLGIARALVVEPELMLYDEPTAGLDPITSKLIAELIITLRRKSKSTLVTVTNDMRRAYQLGDRILFLANGGLIEGGAPATVRQSTNPLIRQFINGLKSGPLTAELA